jgi:hypothetical protein
MQEDEITLTNACADLVSLKKYEAFPLYLLRDKRSGEWVGVRECCARLGLALTDLGPDLFATWLPDPPGHDGYAVVLFYDVESMWSMAAHYNRAHLLASPNGAARSAAAPLSPPEAAPSQH